MSNPSAVFDSTFFTETERGSFIAAQEVLGRIREILPFRSVLDVGCGLGTWLRAARDMGAERILGVDGSYVPTERLLISDASFLGTDLEQPLAFSERFDLALCLEAAEHLSVGRGASLVKELVQASDFVAFSAAIPYQGGDNHLNEMWPTYWADLFAAHRYSPWDGIRSAIWDLQDVPWWYRQNLLVFVADGSWNRLLGERLRTARSALTRVHPECYLYVARRAAAEFKTTYETDVRLYRDAEAGKGKPPGYGPEFAAPLVYGRKAR